MVQYIDHIDSEFKLFGLVNQIGVESQVRRTLDPSEAKTAHLSRDRIHEEKPALVNLLAGIDR